VLHILAGPDDFSMTQALTEIKRGLGDPAALANCTSILEGQRVSADELRHAVETVPFLADKRLVVIYGLIERFEPVGKSERSRASKAAQMDVTPFVRCLASVPKTTVAVMVEGEVPDMAKGKFQELGQIAQVKVFPMLREQRLKPWVQERVSVRGGAISPAAASLLVQYVGSNLWAMANEIDKLVAYAGGRRIEDEDVRSLVGYTQDVSVFALIDAILDFNSELAAQLLQQLLRQGAAPPFMLFMLDRQFRMILRAKDMKASGTADSVVRSRLAIFNDYAFRRTVEQADRYSMERLRQIYSNLLDADLSMKTGSYEDELAMELLVAELCRAPGGSVV
jgi:DNA polymerase III subunit delta